MFRNSAKMFILLLSLALLATGCSSPTDPVDLTYGGNAQPEEDLTPSPVTIGMGLGNEAPDFTLPDTYGDNVVLSDLRGGPVLLFFWATGCVYCEEQYPRIQDFHESYTGSLTVISVNIGDDPQLINAYLADRGLTFPCLVGDGAMQSAYNISSVPHSVLIDSEGLVDFNNHPGYLNEAILEEEF